MRPAAPLQAGLPGRVERSASALLGRRHPLVRVLDALTAIVCQSLVVATVLGVSLIAAARDAPWGPAVAVGAGLVLAVLGVAALLLRQRRREQVLALIAASRDHLPLAPVERERRRLLDWHTRSCLAACLEPVVDEAGKRSLPGMPALFDRRVVGRCPVSCSRWLSC